MKVSRTLPNVPLVVASSCASDRCAHASSKRRFAQRLYVKKSGSPVVIALISFHDLSSNNAREETMGEMRGDGERAGHRRDFGTRTCFARQDKRRHTSASGVAYARNISDARVLDPCLTPVCRALLHTGFPPSNTCFPIRRLSLTRPEESSRKNHATRHSRRKTAERSSPMERHASDGSKNGGVCFPI